MSWDGYVTNMTAQGASQAAIFTKAGQPCAVSEGFTMTAAEVQTLKNCMEGNSNGDTKIEINSQPCTMINYSKDESWVQTKTKPGVSDTLIFYHMEASTNFFTLCGMSGPNERNAVTICHGICEYLKTTGN